MKRSIHKMEQRLLFALALFVITPWPFSCTAAQPVLESSNVAHEPQTDTTQSRKQNTPGETECARGEPEPVLTDSNFKKISHYSAYEEYKLNENITLIIRHGGCAHYLEEYQFCISNSQTKEDWRGWMSFAADLLDTLPVREVAAAQIHEMAGSLRNRAKSNTNYAYKTDIPITETESLSFDVKRDKIKVVKIIIAFQIVL